MELHEFLYSKYIFSSKKDSAPDNGAESFFCSTKSEYFHPKQYPKVFVFCESAILREVSHWHH